jgi:sarcosine oxidase subunit gamma
MADHGTTAWVRRGAWQDIAAAGRFGVAGTPGVTATLRDGFGLASLIVPDGGADRLAAQLSERLGLDLPRTPAVAIAGGHAVIWSGPGQWLLRAGSRAGFAALLAGLAGVAAVSDQSDGRAALSLSGPRVREMLAKGAMVDLHPSSFPVHAVALTSFAHIAVQIWRAADGPDGAVFEIMVARSMAGSFWTWFAASAAEYGCAVATGRG